jgi:hypothetical protein
VGHVVRSAGAMGSLTGDLFLGSSRIHPTLLGQHENCHIRLVMSAYVSCISSGFSYMIH